MLVGLLVGWTALLRTPRSVMLSLGCPAQGWRFYGVVGEEICCAAAGRGEGGVVLAGSHQWCVDAEQWFRDGAARLLCRFSREALYREERYAGTIWVDMDRRRVRVVD